MLQQDLNSELLYQNLEKLRNISSEASNMIKMIIQENIRVINQEQSGLIFLYSIEGDTINAALHIIVESNLSELKWLGSLIPGRGKILLQEGMCLAKEQGAKILLLTSEWQSEPYYEKLGFNRIDAGSPIFEIDINHKF